jgi:hypothetical protein
MRILREKRLNQELMNGVTLTQLRNKLFQDKELLMDNDRLLQAIDVQKDLNIVQEWIEIEFKVFLDAHKLNEEELKDKEYVQSLYENYLENTLQSN